MAIYIVKAGGSRVRFKRSKVVRTARHFHAPRDIAEKVADKVSSKVKNGTTTSEILEWIQQELSVHHPHLGKRMDLRKALSLIPPSPIFETYVQRLLRLEGFDVGANEILRGQCCEHEVDGILNLGKERWFIEIKHHYEDHTLTKLDVPRIAYAILEDLRNGYKQGVQPHLFTGVLIVCNTKLSLHARKYSECYNLSYMGWKTPR
ncbi:MAG: restriction endonuclease, partial [Candidatus Ranarchaeia archaeon]